MRSWGRARRWAGAGMCAALSSSVVVLAAGPAHAEQACVTDPAGDVVDEATGQPAAYAKADVLEYCVVPWNGDWARPDVTLTMRLAEYSDPGTDPSWQGFTFLEWHVTTDADPDAEFVVFGDEFGAEVYDVVGLENEDAPLCDSEEPIGDGAGYRVAVPGWCFPHSTRLAVTGASFVDSDPSDPDAPYYTDDGTQATGAVRNDLPPLEERYSQLGGPRSQLGLPVGSAAYSADNREGFQQYERGIIDYDLGNAGSPTNEVYGAIYQRWLALGGYDAFGPPVTGELPTGDGRGRFSLFAGGGIWWTPTTGAHAVAGPVRDRWTAAGREHGLLGYPTTSERGTPDGAGRYNHFERGSVYWTPWTGAREVHGAIRETWSRLGWERSALGYPVTDERSTPDTRGRYSHFERGSVYWTPWTGAHEVRGAIRETWARLGWERTDLGYPVTDELGTPDGRGRYNHFERGSVYWTPTTGAHEVRGAFRGYWSSIGWERSWLGYPVTDEYRAFEGQGQDFQFGRLRWDYRTGRVTATRR